MKLKNNKWLILISTGIMIMLINIDMTIVNLALAKMAVFFHANMNQVQWIIGSYLLATALSFIIFGRLADHWGRKKIFLLGILLFTFASFIAGITDNLTVLILARFIQGLGFAATLGLSLVLIVNAFPENKKGFATGIAITISGLAQALGPTLGGIILQYLNWHWIFLINVPLGLASFAMSSMLVPKDLMQAKDVPFKFFDVLLFVSGLGIILYSFNQVSIINWKMLLVLLMTGLFLLIIFIKNCRKRTKALIEIHMLNNRGYLLIILLRMIFMIMMCSLLFLLPLYLQNLLDFSPFKTGLTMLLITLLIAFASPITGKLLDKIEFSYLVTLSFLLVLFSTLLMLRFNVTVPNYILVFSFIFFGLAVGVHTPASINGAMRQIVKEKSGAAIGMFFTAAMVGATMGVAMSGTLINMVSDHFLQSSLKNFNTTLPAEVTKKLFDAANGTYNINHVGLTNLQIGQYQAIVHHAFINAFRIELVVLLILSVIALGICWQLKRKAILVDRTTVSMSSS